MSYSEVCTAAQTPSNVGQIPFPTSCSLSGASSEAGPAAASHLKDQGGAESLYELVLELSLSAASEIYWCF